MEAGEDFIITQKGKPVARLAPISNKRILTEKQQAALPRFRETVREGWSLQTARSTGTPCMSVDRFTLDTNILIYSIDVTAGKRHGVAVDIIEQAVGVACCLTLQSISEFFAAATCKRSDTA